MAFYQRLPSKIYVDYSFTLLKCFLRDVLFRRSLQVKFAALYTIVLLYDTFPYATQSKVGKSVVNNSPQKTGRTAETDDIRIKNTL